jgi:hypothetical protein
MTMQRVLVAATAINLALLLFLLAKTVPPVAASVAPVLRGSALQIVDDLGRVRASLNVMPASAGQTETVLLRLIDAAGQPSVKIATSETGSGLSFVGGDDKSYIILQAEGSESSLKIVEPEGREQTISP